MFGVFTFGSSAFADSEQPTTVTVQVQVSGGAGPLRFIDRSFFFYIPPIEAIAAADVSELHFDIVSSDCKVLTEAIALIKTCTMKASAPKRCTATGSSLCRAKGDQMSIFIAITKATGHKNPDEQELIALLDILTQDEL